MRNPFRTEPAVVGPVDQSEAYREGRVDERDRLLDRDRVVTTSVASSADVDKAYQRGRQRERLARRGSPLFNLIILLAVVVAGVFIYLAVRQGSFTGAGAVVDQKLDQTAHTINAPLKSAAENTGDALKKAGQDLK